LPPKKAPQSKATGPAVYFTPHFRIEELARCHDGTFCPAKYMPNLQDLAIELEAIRKIWKRPITILSGWRSRAWNKTVGGASGSMHLVGKAADIVVVGVLPEQAMIGIEAAIKAGDVQNGGLGTYKTWNHYDIGKPGRRWNG
jgi:uncharacterized protein YcbK (DUF882 family)